MSSSSPTPSVPREHPGTARDPLRVLFVDDDACILGGLADALRRRPPGWDTRFALGGQAALDALSARRFDVVVSDLGMPGLDGITVLERAREQQPEAVRIVLSGGAERGAALAASRVAHRYIAKPFREDDVRTAIDRACRLRSLLREEGWRRAAGGVMALPSCPRIYTELTELVADPDATAADAAAVVERDIAMTAKVLQLVNSAFFGLGRRISRMPEAVQYLGLNTLRALVLHAGASEAFAPTRPIEGFSIAALQHRSHLAARIARASPRTSPRARRPSRPACSTASGCSSSRRPTRSTSATRSPRRRRPGARSTPSSTTTTARATPSSGRTSSASGGCRTRSSRPSRTSTPAPASPPRASPCRSPSTCPPRSPASSSPRRSAPARARSTRRRSRRPAPAAAFAPGGPSPPPPPPPPARPAAPPPA